MKRFLKRLALGVLLVAVPFSYVQAANFVRSFTSVADEAGGLANVKCTSLGGNDGAGIVYLSTGIEYWFYDNTATDAADATHVRCNGYTSSGVWENVGDLTPPTHDPVTVTGDSLELTGQDLEAHANLEAIADADTGVTDPGITTYDSDDSAGTSFFRGTSSGGTNPIVMSIGVEEAGGVAIDYTQHDGTDMVTKNSRMVSAAIRMEDANTSAADYTVTSELGSNLEDWNGVRIMTTRTSGNYDVVIPDCATPMNINGVSSTINKYDAQITVCQNVASQVVSVVSASAGDNFITRNTGGLTDGYELDSPGIAQARVCVSLTCVTTVGNGVWIVFDETGGEPCTAVDSGTHLCTDGMDPTWIDGGAAD